MKWNNYMIGYANNDFGVFVFYLMKSPVNENHVYYASGDNRT